MPISELLNEKLLQAAAKSSPFRFLRIKADSKPEVGTPAADMVSDPTPAQTILPGTFSFQNL